MVNRIRRAVHEGIHLTLTVGRVFKFYVVPDLAPARHDSLPVKYPISFETRDGNPIRRPTKISDPFALLVRKPVHVRCR